jgi:hypothetical protein
MNALTLYERAMGDRYARLPAAVQHFHRLQGRVVLHGSVETFSPTSSLGRWLARFLGTPRQDTAGPIRFELDASPDHESWTRRFPSQRMTSHMRWVQGRIEERLGAARLTFELSAEDGALTMKLIRLRFFGVRCPRWLMPHVVAEERGEGDALHFRVSASLPLAGVVASYHGHLVLQRSAVP